MGQMSAPLRITIDLNQFKLHVEAQNNVELTLQFNSPSRKFYLGVIALVVIEMKKAGKIRSVPLGEHHRLLALLNETIGGSAGSSETVTLLSRIYRKWQHALPNLEEAPLFTVLGRRKGYEEGPGKSYRVTETERDIWANLFEYSGSHENVRLKIAIDRVGATLDDIVLIYEDRVDEDAWNKFTSSLVPEKAESEKTISTDSATAGPLPGRERSSSLRNYRWLIAIAAAVVVLITSGLAVRKIYPRFEVASVKNMAFPLPEKPSIAVLPFADISADPKQEFLSDAVTEGVVTTLSKIPELFVIAQYSSYAYKGRAAKTKQVAEELGVRYVLKGSVQKSADQARINVQLIDSTTGRYIWSEKYDRDMRNLFLLTDKVARDIAIALQVKLTEGEQARALYMDTNDPETWALATQAWHLVQQGLTREINARVRELSERAVKLDPRCGFAWSLLAYANFNAARMGWCESATACLDTAVELNRRALSLNKNLFCATGMLGQIQLARGEYELAVETGRRSIELGPSQSVCYLILGTTLRYAGNFGESIAMCEKAVRLHPLCPYFYFQELALSYRMAGRYEEAMVSCRQALNRARKDGVDLLALHVGLSDIYSEMGRIEEAHAEVSEIRRADPAFSLSGIVGVPALCAQKLGEVGVYKDRSYLEKRLISLRRAGLA